MYPPAPCRVHANPNTLDRQEPFAPLLFLGGGFSRGCWRGVDIRGGYRSLRPLHTWIHAGDTESAVYQLTRNAHLPYQLRGRLVGHFLYERAVRIFKRHVVFQVSIGKKLSVTAADGICG